MKNKIIYSCFVACLFMCAGYTSLSKKTSGAHPGSTGAPDDLTCAQTGCHSDAKVISNAVANNTLVFSANDSSYVPGQTYSITVQVQGSGINPVNKFGFELVAIKDADSLNVGQFIITDAVRTQIINHLSPKSDVRYSVTHKTAGTPALSSNYSEWQFLWTAPPTNEGKITFYYATNCTNDNGQNSGDNIFLHSFQIHPYGLSSIKEIADTYDMKTWYEPEAKEVFVSFDLKGTREVQVAGYDQAGNLVYQGGSAKLSGKQKQKVLAGDLSKGAYLIQLLIGDQIISKKVIIY